jgi:hypothetical protein
MNGGLPVHDEDGYTIQFTKDDFQKWVDTSMKIDRHKKASDANYELFKARIEKEMIKSLPKGSLPGAGQSYRASILQTVGTRASYDRYLQEGSADKPVSELKKKHREWHPLKGLQPFAK